jgi:UDP-N-acetylmuramoylalanine--D-glutamate ligase
VTGALPASVLVFGFAVTGTSVARRLVADGVRVVAADDAPDEEMRRRAAEVGVELLESPRPETLAGVARRVEAVVASPGVPLAHPVFATGVPVLSEVELAGRLASAPMVAVTGTNGKTTVTTLVTRMLKAQGRRALAAGNIGLPLLDAVAMPADVLVVEVSSFQLALTERFHPLVAVYLNLAPDHLDWHPSFEHYAASKARVWANQGPQDVAVANAEDPAVMAAAASAPSRLVTFGLAAGDYRERGGRLCAPDGEVIIEADRLPRPLPHDRANALAATAAARAAGAELPACRRVLADFNGLPHRVQLVGEVRGVRYYDDSKATTPASVLAALSGFDSAVLIAGGRNKGLDLSVLGSARRRLRAVVAVGEAGDEVAAVFSDRDGSVSPEPGAPDPPVIRAASMAEAVEAAAAAARPGDAVLLSPGCASFDWYRSYAERGEDFARLVQEMAKAGGGGR